MQEAHREVLEDKAALEDRWDGGVAAQRGLVPLPKDLQQVLLFLICAQAEKVRGETPPAVLIVVERLRDCLAHIGHVKLVFGQLLVDGILELILTVVSRVLLSLQLFLHFLGLATGTHDQAGSPAPERVD